MVTGHGEVELISRASIPIEKQAAFLKVKWEPLDVHRTVSHAQIDPMFPPTPAVKTNIHELRLRRYFIFNGRLLRADTNHITHEVRKSSLYCHEPEQG